MPTSSTSRKADDLLNELLGINPTRRDHIKTPRKLSPQPIERIYFDAERFRYYFANREGLSLQAWRDKIDKEMRLSEKAQHPATSPPPHNPS